MSSDPNGLPSISKWPSYIGAFVIGMIRALFSRRKP